ncbi:formate dehydrogenase subunit gamma [Leptolyngbya sp. 15MV]|nr:formate dehydrogenase subunit gamma [Leptolyngbya sp. 15MV]
MIARILPAFALAFALLAAPAMAQIGGPVSGTPTNPIAPNLSAEELELQKALQGGRIAGRVSIPDAQSASLIQPEGRDWRAFHNVTLTWVGGIAVLGMLGIVLLFYLSKGRIPVEAGMSGRTIQRFNGLERAAHWMTASSFIVLALSGLNLTFGRWLLLPLLGPETFATVTLWGKYAHNYLSFPFTLGVVLLFLLWVKDNIPNGRDVAWFKAGGGLVGHGHPEAERFNGGQKIVFWITVLGGTLVAISGYVLIFPFFVTDIAGMQLAHIVHGVVSVLMIGAIIGHIYIGSAGMEGAFDAMGSGQVDLNWAKQHHALWARGQAAGFRGQRRDAQGQDHLRSRRRAEPAWHRGADHAAPSHRFRRLDDRRPDGDGGRSGRAQLGRSHRPVELRRRSARKELPPHRFRRASRRRASSRRASAGGRLRPPRGAIRRGVHDRTDLRLPQSLAARPQGRREARDAPAARGDAAPFRLARTARGPGLERHGQRRGPGRQRGAARFLGKRGASAAAPARPQARDRGGRERQRSPQRARSRQTRCVHAPPRQRAPPQTAPRLHREQPQCPAAGDRGSRPPAR